MTQQLPVVKAMEHATTPNPIDLARDIRELRKIISAGREKLRSAEARTVFETWRQANERYESALNRLNDLTSRPSSSQEQIARQNESTTNLEKENGESWVKVRELTAFVQDFGVGIEVLLSRLPKQTAWERFPELIQSLRFRSPDSWIQYNTSLDTLDMRLGEMLELLTIADQDEAPPCAKGRLSNRDSEIEKAIIRKFGEDWYAHHDNPEIIRQALQDIGVQIMKPTLTKSQLRAILNRIRSARGHCFSKSIREQRRPKN